MLFHDHRSGLGIFEFAMDRFFGLDMQKDTVVHSISSVMLDPAGGNHPAAIRDITDVVINGESLGLGAIWILPIDTMQDLFVNLLERQCFSVIGYFYVKNRGKENLPEG